ncbi:hypothetical protein ACFQZF_10415 [Flavobacterium myungsuense]|uniref:Uncharacterized protein n=1 Tax=Flavobacterium myungsuense TaxID=651823 RepID=A0ABW3J375_9FLAO
MKIAYLLECYDVRLRQVASPHTVSNKYILDDLSKNESNSYRIYSVTIKKWEGKETLNISKPKHSFHPKVLRLELKSLFQFNEFENYIPILKNHIEFTGESIFFAADPERLNTFFVYEKCAISELPPKERFFLYCHQSLNLENQNIKLAIKEKVFKFKSKLKIEHYIHKNQLTIEYQLNKLIKQINPETNNELYEFLDKYDNSDCLKSIYRNLENLLVFIEKEYHDFLNVNIMVPWRTVLMNEYEIKPKLDFVRDSLLSMEIDQELLKIIFDPVLIVSTINIQKQITYYQFNYAVEYISELAQLLIENPNETRESEIFDWLLDLNINSFRNFDYITSKLQFELNTCESDYERLELLYKKLKKFNQHRSKIKKSFNEKLPEIKVQICNWLEEEIEFINRKRNLEDQHTGNPKEIKTNNKILLGLSVAQISYFVNILMQTGIIKHSNQREVFRMIADNFKTNVTDNISVDSLSSKFFNVETSTKNRIKEKIIELLNLTKK